MIIEKIIQLLMDRKRQQVDLIHLIKIRLNMAMFPKADFLATSSSPITLNVCRWG